mmetsp:Transcript_16008/g.43562  ORF Transcript_16008/g.43562 Transcript_16008/m.43562 type:complete len:255 (+) Transcript_16008:348-1112(+)
MLWQLSTRDVILVSGGCGRLFVVDQPALSMNYCTGWRQRVETHLIDDSNGVLHTTRSDGVGGKAVCGLWACHPHLSLQLAYETQEDQHYRCNEARLHLNRGLTCKFSVTAYGNEYISCFDASPVRLPVIRDGSHHDTLSAAATQLDVKPWIVRQLVPNQTASGACLLPSRLPLDVLAPCKIASGTRCVQPNRRPAINATPSTASSWQNSLRYSFNAAVKGPHVDIVIVCFTAQIWNAIWHLIPGACSQRVPTAA